MAELQYKVGDKLKVTGNVPYFPKDTVVRIVQVDSRDMDLPYQLFTHGIGYSWIGMKDMDNFIPMKEE